MAATPFPPDLARLAHTHTAFLQTTAQQSDLYCSITYKCYEDAYFCLFKNIYTVQKFGVCKTFVE